ncbi:MAG: protoporphyrinogen/coproporphyrinogen oxidase [Halobacteriota archaeon]
MRIAILGGGLTGLTVGYLLEQKGVEFEILERESECGGLMKTIEQDGFTFDVGGSHIIFSKDEPVLDFMLSLIKDNGIRSRRNTKILYKGAHVKYPFENGLADLSRDDNFECLHGFVQSALINASGPRRVPENFKEWCYFVFGTGIAEKYLIPYNEKIWKFPIDRMSTEWVQRVPHPPLEDVIKSSLGFDVDGYKEQLFFYYPRFGGIWALIKSLQDRIDSRIIRDFNVAKIRKEREKWTISDGNHERSYDSIISTIPLPDLVEAVDTSSSVKDAAKRLMYNSLITVMFGLDVASPNDFSWLYMPDENSSAHRVSFPSNYSRYAAPKAKSSVLAEITCRVEDELWKMRDADIARQVCSELHESKILNKADVCYWNVQRSKYAYVINDLDRLKNVSLIREGLIDTGIDLVGRFAEFEYLNMDGCIRHAMRFVEERYGSG